MHHIWILAGLLTTIILYNLLIFHYNYRPNKRDEIIKMISSIAKKFSDTIHTAPWYYRLMRRIYNIHLELKSHEDRLNTQIGAKSTLQSLQQSSIDIIKLSQQYNRLSYWLLGFDKLISQCQSIVNEEIQEEYEKSIDAFYLKRSNENKVIPQKLLLKDSVSSIREHLENQKAFLKQNIKPLPVEKMPHTIGRMGSYYYYGPITLSTANQPLTDSNLKSELRQTQTNVARARVDLEHYPYHSHEWQDASFTIDTSYAIFDWIKEAFKKLTIFYQPVEINADGIPFISVNKESLKK